MKREQTKKPIRTAIILMFIRLMPIWLILAALIAGAMLFLPIFGKPFIQLITVENQSGSDLVLEEIRDVYRFNTIEYNYKIVFPFDYDVPGVSGWKILRKISTHITADPKTFLTMDEQTWLKSVEIAKRNRLKIYDPEYQFLVATVIIRAGFDLKGTGLDQSAGISPVDRARFVSFNSTQRLGKTVRTAQVTLPPAAITDITIEDPIRNEYLFPDIGLEPKGWKEIAAFVQEQTQIRAINEGILEKARENARLFIQQLLASIGIDEVSFN